MFHSSQMKHEYMKVEDINCRGEINSSNTTKYPSFTNDLDYKYCELPQFWNRAQVANEVYLKNEHHNQHNRFHAEENNSLAHTENCLQSNTIMPFNQEESLNKIYQQHHIYMTQKTEQLQLVSNMQAAKVPKQRIVIQTPVHSIKPKLPERPTKFSSKTNPGEKSKCQCAICFKEFGHKSNLFIHMRTHNGERPYKCTQCEKCFTHSGNLAIHMRTHSGERPYGCQVCGKMFSHSGNLSTHLRTHSGIKPYKCTVCGKEFRHSGNLSTHQRIHSGIKPFQCKVCGKDFCHSGNLTTHMKKHTTNVKTSINQYDNDVGQPTHTASLKSINNLPFASTTNVKLVPNVNIV